MGCIYLIRNGVNGKGYIGQTINPVPRRFKQHINAASRGVGYILYDAIRKYGPENFSIAEVCRCENHLLNDLEKHYIEFYGTFHLSGHGYNLTKGGEDWNLGRVHSAETRAKIGASNKGKIRSPEFLKYRSLLMTGRTHSQATRDKMSVSRMGKKHPPLSEESRARIAAAQKGKKLSAEHRRKIGESQKGKIVGPMPESTKIKISLTKKRLFAESRAIQ